MNNTRSITMFLLVSAGLLLPLFAFAPGGYNVLAPLGPLGASGPVTLGGYLTGAFQILIGIAGVLAVVMIVVCGIRMMGSASASGKSEAKSCITRSIIGLILAVSSWVGLYTINPDLLKADIVIRKTEVTVTPAPPPTATELRPTIPGWYYQFRDSAGSTRYKGPWGITASDQCFAAAKDAAAQPGTTIVPDATTGKDCFLVPLAPITVGENSVRNALCGNNSCVNATPIGINKGPCPFVGATGCTNVEGLASTAITAIQNLQSAYGGNVVISGGTEWWSHSCKKTGPPCKPWEHYAGNAVFDLRLDYDGLGKYIISNATDMRGSFQGKEYRLMISGAPWWFTHEDSLHWHVCKEDDSSVWYCRPCFIADPKKTPTEDEKKRICQPPR